MKFNLALVLQGLVLLRLATLGLESSFWRWLVNALLLTLAVFVLFKRSGKTGLLRANCASYFFIGLSLCAIYGVFIAFLRGDYFLFAITDGLLILVFMALIFLGYEFGVSQRKFLLAGMLLILLFVNLSVFGSLVGLLPAQEVEGILRPEGFVGSVQNVSHLVQFSAFISFYLLVEKQESPWKPTFVVIILFISLASIIATSSMKTVLVTPLGFLFILVALGRLRIGWLTLGVVIIASITYVAAELDIGLNQRVENFLQTGVDLSVVDGKKAVNTFEFRLSHWYSMFLDWKENYLFFGVGLGQSRQLVGISWHLGANLDPHNDVIKLWFEYGLIGGAFCTALWFSFVRFLWRSGGSSMSRFAASAIFTFTLVGVAGKVFFSAYNIYLFSIILGIAMRDICNVPRYLAKEPG